MLEYRTAVAALHAFRDGLAGQKVSDPNVAQLRDQHLDDLATSFGFAVLGSSFDQLLWHATVGKEEIDLLEQVHALWSEGMKHFVALDSYRKSLEVAHDHPSDPSSVQAVNAAAEKLTIQGPIIYQQAQRLHDLRKRVVRHEYLPEHPRQLDVPIDKWNWSDLLLARRTDALIRELFRNAATPATRAFSLGVLARYGATHSASMYIAQTVGGPRRSHRLRSRVATYAVGAWMVKNRKEIPSLQQLAQLLNDTMPGGLDVEIENLLKTAISAVFPTDALPPLPDVRAGFDRLKKHLQLLSAIRMPDPPRPPGGGVAEALYGDPASPYVPTLGNPSGHTESGGEPGVPGSGGGLMIQSVGDDGPSHQEPPDSTEVKCGAFWEALGQTLAILLGGWFACVVETANTGGCKLWDDMIQNWQTAFSNGVYVGAEIESDWPSHQALTVKEAEALAGGQQLVQFIGDLFDLQCAMWEAFSKALEFLTLHGLTYPDAFLGHWRYRQFTTIPAHDSQGWPRLSYLGDRFDLYPDTAPELPGEETPFRPGTGPAAILTGASGGGPLSGLTISLPIWSQIAEQVLDAENLDLDADRGWRHPCWRPGSSIMDQPLSVEPLNYEEI
jgi:hypothetical protein